MTMIDLLNKIANDKETPKRIRWNGKIYYYSDKDRLYYNDGFSMYKDLYAKGNRLNDEIEILKPEKKIKLKGLYLSEAEKEKYRLIEIHIYNINNDSYIPNVLCLLKGDAKKCKRAEIDSSHVNCFFDHNGELHFCCYPESIDWDDVIYLIYNLAKDGLITEY